MSDKQKHEIRVGLELENGEYTGKIIGGELRETGTYKYLDFEVSIDGTEEKKIKFGFNWNLGSESELSAFLFAMGCGLELDKEYEAEDITALVYGKEIKFYANNKTKEGKDGKEKKFVEVTKDTISLKK